MNEQILLSIVIATKNRQTYCLSAVESILSLSNTNIQVIVQDNSDEKTLDELLNLFENDHRLIYRYTPPPFSSIDNFNAAIELATGEYVCLIGDDDGINPQIFEAAQWAKDNNIDALVGNIKVNYRWEGTGASNTFFTKMTGSTLTILDFNSKAKQIDIEASLRKLMENGCTNYLEYPLPKLYHGIVKKNILDRIKEETGQYLKGLSPDIYSAISLACHVNKLIYIDYPLTIPGVCGQSTSITEGQLKKHSKKLEDAPHFRDRGVYKWTEQVPKIYCVQTIWADSGFAALREMGRKDLIKKFNKYSLYGNILQADSTLKPLLQEKIDEDIAKNSFNVNKFKLKQISIKIRDFVKRGNRRLKIILGITELKNVTDLKDISKAMSYLTDFLNEKKINFIENLNKINIK
ncbi:glycosyltransferase family 2 protein [Elizabethkingia anophelis]|uniref:glycosyltransferase family 2 protein n=1 Tax=Elizabethkingia anophelis TaxID=1117645 RepID=UPI0021A2CA45|nr:glycosyltransferase family 2 protein [Elizabethkingia anophelis]MCT3977718.1 glycosyltransferase family 2 protein [Elizabethkingia anophelis]MCT4041333.1 glycosyltransferase family 2 protein [Elizabethkingia anophelis]MCT4174029.1 glycosyltransferase family 2 protein [Elizabethkingia anophelis]MCT4177710.1 glycosyltransferase family 2 protein [Elizabethkingia anophelis]